MTTIKSLNLAVALLGSIVAAITLVVGMYFSPAGAGVCWSVLTSL